MSSADGAKPFLDIQRAFLYLIAFHIPIVGLALLPPALGLPLLLMPLHLVWLELVVHPVSALLFQGDPPPDDLMRRPPRSPRAPMLPVRAVGQSAASGALLTIAVFVIYLATLPRSASSWLVWVASGLSLPVLMYIPSSAALLDIAPLSPAGWLFAAGAGAAALGWRVPLALRRRSL